ncbi:probable 3',5'-cyclic phosphodiesterase pde-5 isoform X2 [Condylostylus longicornis]|uniref:probable 3',5'-cyclic phosphodiesterase pde-5 isoform X2 n=1 Tax=Condylostylus longicornis TaxID=2530218 RepID=UPI00244E2B7C|nr:probable 3',5'-cyclic phosphodiesterase pde-5 isoform X2 [Condylostylus longicornis]
MSLWNNLVQNINRLWRFRVSGVHENNEADSDESYYSNGEDGISASKVRDFLRDNPDFLEKHVMDEVELELLERWMIRRTQRSRKATTQSLGGLGNRKTSLSRWKFCVHADKRQMLQDLTHSLQLRPTKAHVLWELANCISSAINADGFNLYITENGDPENLSLYLGQNSAGVAKLQKLRSGISVPLYVARTREQVRLSKGDSNTKFPDALPRKSDIAHILCQSVCQPDGQLIAVIELYRKDGGFPFHEEDEEISISYLVWGGIALHYAALFMNMNKQRKLNDFLLAVVKSIFQDMVSIDMLVSKIMNFAQRLVDADRASLFLVDSKSKELYATIFDVGINDYQNGNTDSPNAKNDNNDNKKPREEIRFSIGTGIAGQVALTGEILNIKDAYSDPRFNREVDQKTGYKTDSILCMPIYIRGSIIGVVQMVNKRSGYFTKEDEEAFEMFAVYCGLALHHAKLYDKIRKSEQKYKVAIEVLSYHNTSSDDEVRNFIEDKTPDSVPEIDNYYFNPFLYNDFQKIKFATYMFVDLFGLRRFDKNNLIRFTLTIKKNYRRVPYHNWSHGFSVANSMYSLIKKATDAFKPIECLALYIASLCHDLDHRGKNNKFMLDTESPIAAIYSTSTMEHHHFNQTVAILQQDGHNIFAKLSSNEYKTVLGLIKHCILATDLALFFPNRAKLQALVDDQKFSWNDNEHRLLVQAIAMTASDLSASAKPWEVQENTVKVIFEEFYEQGDAERAAGREPIAMMDRLKPEEQPNSQVGFISAICLPCYSLLHKLIPETEPLLNKCQENLQRWKSIAQEVIKQKSQKLQDNAQ